uniref:L-type lectin-like domain-containing protein n=1 Tax=Glossina palpalis gambiensis TaxID=67801 RepID=A0A1B0BAA5_9MUSC
MSAAGLLVCSFVPILSIFVLNINGQGNPNPGTVGIHRRFEYKYSFKPPYLAQKDGTVPFWEYGGSKLPTPQGQIACPTSNCVGVTLFLSVTVVQLLLIFLYTVFKSRSDAQAKKFY